MRTITYDIYKYHELPKASQEKAYNRWAEGVVDKNTNSWLQHEFIDSLEAFCDLLHLSIPDINLYLLEVSNPLEDAGNRHINFDASGKLLRRFLQSSCGDLFLQPKLYPQKTAPFMRGENCGQQVSDLFHYNNRPDARCEVMKESCLLYGRQKSNLTGTIIDDILLQPIYDFLYGVGDSYKSRTKEEYESITLRDMVQQSFANFLINFEREDKYLSSFDYFIENEADEAEYYYNGDEI